MLTKKYPNLLVLSVLVIILVYTPCRVAQMG